MRPLLCFGTPKSGTTFLQMALNAHPEVSCPSEHQFQYLADRLGRLLSDYNDVLEGIDQRTARQGTHGFRQGDADGLLRGLVLAAARRGAGDRRPVWHGVNDNLILRDLPRYQRLFPEARFVAIVRDPRAVAVSAWHHNQRVEPGFAERGGTDIDGWAVRIARRWALDTRAELALQAEIGPRRMHICRYEDLVTDPLDAFGALFGFLEVAHDPATCEQVIAATRFDRFRGNAFFRKADVDGWQRELQAGTVTRMAEIAGDAMRRMGYRDAEPA